jgi:hypothetical protein
MHGATIKISTEIKFDIGSSFTKFSKSPEARDPIQHKR